MDRSWIPHRPSQILGPLGILTRAATRVSREDVTLRAIGWSRKDAHRIIPPRGSAQGRQIHRDRLGRGDHEGLGQGVGSQCFGGQRFRLARGWW